MKKILTNKKIWWNIALAVGIVAYCYLLAYFCEANAQQSWEKFSDFMEQDWAQTMLRNIALLAAPLIGAVALLTRKLSVGVGLISIGLFIPHVVNYYKLSFRNEPFYPWDLSLAGEAGNIMGSMKFSFSARLIVGAGLILLAILLAVLFDIF